MVDGCLQGIFERRDVAGDLGEEHAALEGGKEQVGQLRGICFGAHSAESLHVLDSLAEDVSPLVERARELIVNVEVGLDDLAREGAEAAAFLVGAFVTDVEGRPLPKRAEGVEAGELLTAMER